MKKSLIIGMILFGTLGLFAQNQVWQKPVVKKCELSPGAQCNVEAICPKSHPIAISGGGGMPKAMPENNQVAMTMNLPVSLDTWRVRWKNLSNTNNAKIKVAVKVLCTKK